MAISQQKVLPIVVRPSVGSAHTARVEFAVFRLILNLIWIFALATLIIYTYAEFTVPVFGYMGYTWNPNTTAMATGVVLALATVPFLPTSGLRASDLAILLLFVKPFLSILVLPAAFSSLTTSDLISFQLVMVIGFLIICALNRFPIISLNLRFFSKQSYELLLYGLAIIMLIPIIWYFGVPSSLPAFGEVYGVRLESRSTFAASPFYLGYFYAWLSKVVAPMMIGFGILTRRPFTLGAGLLITLYLYGVNGQKGLLFTAVLLIGIILGIKLIGKAINDLVLPALLGTIIGAKVLDFLLSSGGFMSLIDRAFVTPGVLTGYNHEFFTENPKGHWAGSFLSWASEYPYDRHTDYLIGLVYFNNPDTNATSPMWADGFANFGLIGVIVVSLVAGIVLWLINGVGESGWWSLSVAMAVIMALNLTGTSIFTGLLTGGVALSLLLLLLLPEESEILPEK